MADLTKQLGDYSLTTAKIIYRLPDYIHLLQEYIWQDYDLAPEFPELKKFLDFWHENLDGPLHSVYVADTKIITSSDYRHAEWMDTLQ